MTAPPATRLARRRFVARLERLLEGPGTYLAVVFAIALAAELVLNAQGAAVPPTLRWLLLVIWGFFIVQFALGFVVSPDRLAYVRRNWLTALSLAVPFLRAFRVLRVVGALRATNALRVLGGFNRTARTLDSALAWTRAGYAAALTATAVLLGSAALLMFEVDAPGSRITDYGEALWWAAATITTVGAATEPVSLGGRLVALALMLGGLVLLGYVAGVLSALLFDRRDGQGPRGRGRASGPIDRGSGRATTAQLMRGAGQIRIEGRDEHGNG